MSASNRLATEPSPYLRQHAQDPVDWYPWGEAAFEKAKAEDKPVLLSIGYSSCHWCHVMARESFRDPAVAELMNRELVSVKVDREERPDVDAVYMAALQAMTGSGGWPLTMVLTPEGEPFYGGTYFPPEDRPGVPGFRRVLEALAGAWRSRRADVRLSAAELSAALKRLEAPAFAGAEAPAAVAELEAAALHGLLGLEDREHGGFGGAPKFPQHEAVRYLLGGEDEEGRAAALRALDGMAGGGVHDQLGGSFFRYAVDASWRVPHFEKMLYDNAALLRAYALAFRLTGEERHRAAAMGIVDWLTREMLSPDGAFYSALDAESEGQEGRYYVWTAAEVEEELGPDLARLVTLRYGLSAVGPVEGANVLRVAATVEEVAAAAALPVPEARQLLADAAQRLLARRAGRRPPGVDDKVLASWNGLMVGALADASVALGDARLAGLAAGAAGAVMRRLWEGGRLWHSWCRGERRVEGLLEDYAYMGLGLLALYRATSSAVHLAWALELADVVAERFHDVSAPGFFNTAADAERLIVRPKGFVDAATPSENAAAAELSWWAARYRDDGAGVTRAVAAVSDVAAAAAEAPTGFASSLRALGLMRRAADAPCEVVVVGRSGDAAFMELASEVRARAPQGALCLVVDGSAPPAVLGLPLLEGRLEALRGGEPRAYVCRSGVCRLPVGTPRELATELRLVREAPSG